jgi:DNA repair exonuclease SbcCD ATPase subunit
MTRREHLERLAERRRDWAKARQQEVNTIRNNEPSYAHDWAFITQPGHIPARARLNAQAEKAYEHGKMAEHHTGKAEGIERRLNTSIFSDDPDAIEAIQAKVAGREKVQAKMREANICVCKKDRPGLSALGFSDARIDQLFAPDESGRLGFPSYALTNNNANIRRLKERIKEIERRQNQTQKAESAGGVLVERHDSGYAKITFSERPPWPTINALKGAGFYCQAGYWFGKSSSVPAEVVAMAETGEQH